jgi:hypothetical protein
MLLQFSACICNDTVFALWVDLREDGTEAARRFVVAEAGVDNEGIGPIVSGVVNDGFGAEISLQFEESLQGIWRQCAAFPCAIFFC